MYVLSTRTKVLVRVVRAIAQLQVCTEKMTRKGRMSQLGNRYASEKDLPVFADRPNDKKTGEECCVRWL